ncbi:MAG TPA: chemotaxis protein CheW [Rhizomicrobium sp.]
MAEAQSSSVLRHFLTFRLDGRPYALPTEDVLEVIHLPPVAKVPQAPKALLGVANLRGKVLPLASLRILLGRQEADTSASRAIVLDGASPAAIAVDSVDTLVAVAVDKIETRQAQIAAGGEKLAGVFEIDALGVVKIVDVKALLNDAFSARAERKHKPSAKVIAANRVGVRDSQANAEVLVTFDVADQEYALALSDVQEIVSSPERVTALPHSEELVVGMMALRGQLLPLLSLRGLLGFKPNSMADAREKVFVTPVGGAIVGLIADRARTIVSADRDLIDPVPSVLAARSGGEARIKAIYRGDSGTRFISILAPDRLFREDVMQRIGPAEQRGPQTESAAPSVERQFVVFHLGAEEFGLPIEAVVEVAGVPEQVTRVPKAPRFLEGVVNLRGEVLPVVDQRRRFDIPVLENSGNRRLIVVRTERHRAGLIVDNVSEVLRSTADAIEPPPDLTGEITRLVHGVINLEADGRIILLLDPAELLTRAERGLLDAFESKAKAAK